MNWRIIEKSRDLKPFIPVQITNVKTGEVRRGLSLSREGTKVRVKFSGQAPGHFHIEVLRFADWTWEEDPNDPLFFATYDGKVIWGTGSTLEGSIADAHKYIDMWNHFPGHNLNPELKTSLCSHRLRVIIENDGGNVPFDKVLCDGTSGAEVLIYRAKRTKK